MKQKHQDAMSPKWRELMEKHPAMFGNLHRPPECAEGWYDLLDELMTKLETTMSTENVNKGEKNVKLSVMQIKEKFGGLRFYAVTDCPFAKAMTIQDLILKAEEKSLSICELCGEKGKLRRVGGWMRTLCDAHYREWIGDVG